MSIKVYSAYRASQKDLWPLVNDIRVQATANVVKILRDLYTETIANVDTGSEEYRKALGGDEATAFHDYYARMTVARKGIEAGYKNSVMTRLRSPFDFDVSLVFRQWKSKLYLRPHCDMLMSGVFDFLGNDPRLEDYHYEDASGDIPEGVSPKEWSTRRKVWLEMDRSSSWMNSLGLDICSWESWTYVNPWLQMAKEFSDGLKAKKP